MSEYVLFGRPVPLVVFALALLALSALGGLVGMGMVLVLDALFP